MWSGRNRFCDRQGGSAELPRWAQWFSPELLHWLHEFYVHLAPDLCPNPPLVINTDELTATEVYDQVTAMLADAGLPVATAPPVDLWPGADRPPLDASFTDLYEELGGLETFGHPLTSPFPHRGGHVQLCQLGALHRDAAGDVRLWDLLAGRSSDTAAV